MTTDPVVVLIYGPSGIGKTTDNGYSFPRALFVAAPGALNSVKSVCGYEPKIYNVATIMEATSLIEQVSKHFDYIVFDDFSFLAEQTFNVMEKRFNGFKLWGELRDAVLAFRDKSRSCGVNIILNAWEQSPKQKDSGRIRGGPKLSGNLPEQLPAMCDVVLRAVHEPRRKPWPAVYRCSSDPNWVMKDRFDVATRCDPAPMNLAEMLRAAGVEVPRHVDLPKQEAQVQTISEALTGDPIGDAETANACFKALRDSGVSYTAARWTLRDALDRAVIRRVLDEAQSSFINVGGALL